MTLTDYRQKLSQRVWHCLLAVAAFAFLGSLLAACSHSTASSTVIRLVDVYKPDVLHGTAAAATAAPKNEWRFDGAEPTPPPKDFGTTRGVEGKNVSLAIRDGHLAGKTTSDFPILRFERTKDLDTPDQFYSVEIRMKVS